MWLTSTFPQVTTAFVICLPLTKAFRVNLLQALSNFENGRTAVMVATDVLGRGIDIDGVGHVINYDHPKSMTKYVHRIGRTGRAGHQGLASTILDSEDIYLIPALIHQIEQGRDPEVPPWMTQVQERIL